MAIAAGQIVYIDYVSGSNTARTQLLNATASNPSGTITRITYNSHGLSNGTAVVLTNFTAWLNTYWLITNVTANTFDLVDAVWQATADATGDVRPLGGQSWADAWKTIQGPNNYGVGYPSAEYRFAKSDDPTSIGNATWTNLSSTVTLATAQNILIDNAEVNWTAANTATCATQTSRKQGATSVRTTLPAAPAINTKYSYRATGTLNLSAYQKITLWIYTSATTADTSRIKIKLCSDTTGDTPVDEFSMPIVYSANQWFPVTIAKDGGGNLGSSIQSIAIYSGSSAPAASFYVQVDNISAATTSGLCLNSLISKSSHPKDMDHTWHAPASISGTAIVLDDTPNAQSGVYRGYSGTTETVTTYTFIPIPIAVSNTSVFLATSASAGTITANVKILGGWNKSNTTQDGFTFFDGGGNVGSTLTSYFPFNINRGFYYVERIGFTRAYSVAFYLGNNSTITKFQLNCSEGISNNYGGADSYTFNNIIINNCSSGFTTNNGSYSKSIFTNIVLRNCGSGISNRYGDYSIFDTVTIDNCGSGVSGYAGIGTIFRNFTVTNTTNSASSNPINSVSYCIFENWVIGPDLNSGSRVRAMSTVSNCVINKMTVNGSSDTSQSPIFYMAGNERNTVINDLTYTNVAAITGVAGTVSYQPTNTNVAFNRVNGSANDNRYYIADNWSPTQASINRIITGTLLSQTSVRHTASGIAWQANVLGTQKDSATPFTFPITKIAFNANTAVTVKCWVKKSHATDIAGGLKIEAYEIPGITSDITTTKSNDTNWEELTISFTPTDKGVAQIYGQAWWVSNAATQSVYFDDITVTQA